MSQLSGIFRRAVAGKFHRQPISSWVSGGGGWSFKDGISSGVFLRRDMATLQEKMKASIGTRYADWDRTYSAEEIGLFTEEDAKKLSPRAKQDLGRQLKEHAMIHVHLTMNNTKVLVSDIANKVITSTSSGTLGFKGPKRGQSVSAEAVGRYIAVEAKEKGMRTASVRFKGVGRGREALLKTFREHGLIVKVISDVTMYPFNGCKPKKMRRV